ncbi:MAG: hypothetical protein AAGA50_29905, partial [Pseudomonadota bacterium]
MLQEKHTAHGLHFSVAKRGCGVEAILIFTTCDWRVIADEMFFERALGTSHRQSRGRSRTGIWHVFQVPTEIDFWRSDMKLKSLMLGAAAVATATTAQA